MLAAKSFGVFSIGVEMANPNGDIDNGSPRISGQLLGWISPYRIKRELRNQLEDHSDPSTVELLKQLGIKTPENFSIFESRLKGFDGIKGIDDLKAKNQAVKLFQEDGKAGLERYWDIRLFGGTLLEGETSKGANDATRYVRTGAVQISSPVSILPIVTLTSGLSKKSPLDKDHLTGGSKAGTGTFGQGAIKLVEHGVYYGFYSVSASESHKTGMTDLDLEVFKSVLPHMFSRHAAQQVGVNVIQAFHCTHNNLRGSFNEFGLIELARPRAKTQNATSFSDYAFVTQAAIKKYLGKSGQLEVLTDVAPQPSPNEVREQNEALV